MQTGEKKEVKEISKYDIKTFKEENDEELHRISKNEIELIKEIGENGFFDQRQLKKYNEETLLKLNMKEYLEIEEVEYRGQKIYQFRLTMKGRKIFKEHFGKEITSPSREEIIEEFGDIEKGLLLYTAKEEFYKKGYEIEDINEERIEIMKEKVIIHLTPDFGIFRDVDYDEILNKTNQLKKIGFIAESEEIMKKSIQAVENWVEKNKNKSRMLKVHFTNLEKVKEKEPFEIKKY